ncbi:nuclear transport factor 2 family protein [Saccharopolyspora sp. TS4A08]|uniref:Nuclear transport factor 2 family protein n=1 Tax=Saccharopolyspora ipomoeae TaxID=3042027 RepID=A0ABT6PM39_9PSEU|nr:nuclear transport factor 2 family protein [Saccharopolyspora sp. TS4A08]MDI2029072.1 nuclear transport factor 2 family protein [Saccharopolyspora sp. TS4A08]
MTEEAETARRRPTLSLVLFVVSLVCALVFGVLWVFALNNSSVAYAETRDAALQQGQEAIINFNTLDHKDVDRGLQRWEDYSTGPLRDEVKKGRKDYATRIQQAKSTTTARVLDAGIAELDENAGKARMIAVVQITVTVEGQPPANKQDRYQAELTREGDVWKLSGLGTVPVG